MGYRWKLHPQTRQSHTSKNYKKKTTLQLLKVNTLSGLDAKLNLQPSLNKETKLLMEQSLNIRMSKKKQHTFTIIKDNGEKNFG
jgi:hypothetical protein